MTADIVGGVRTYVQDLVDALDADVEVATMGPGTPYRLEWEQDPWEDVDRAGTWLLELEAELRPDVIHLNGFAHGSLPWRAPVVVVAHSDVVSWWCAVHGEAPPARYDRYRSAVEAGLRAAHLVVAPTRAVLADLQCNYRLRGPRLVVPNGSSFEPSVRDKEPFVLSLGRFWDEAKNVAALERARSGSLWPVVVAGAGTRRGEISRDDVRELLARASVYCAPARYEPFGLAILEAARSGCALVLGDIPSLREIWADAALFAAPDDDEMLASSLRLLARNDELRRELAMRARRRAAAFTAERMAAGYRAVYDRVLARVAA